MRVVITGGTGFLGIRLAKRLVELAELTVPSGERRPIGEITLFDSQEPSAAVPEAPFPIRIVIGDISERDTVDALIDRDDISVFHLASVVSGGGEQDFDLAMRVNHRGGINVLEALRARNSLPRLVFASSIAVFGGSAMPDTVGDATRQTPQTTYGITKAILELLINDYTRKGFLDGRSARLPTAIIRPGKPNAAASGFASGVFREPLAGVDFVLPVPPETVMVVLGYRAIVDGLIQLHEVDGAELGDDLSLGLPGHRVTAQEMIDALHRTAGSRALGNITVDPDPFITSICETWPQSLDSARADALGFPKDEGLDAIVRYYIEDYLSD